METHIQILVDETIIKKILNKDDSVKLLLDFLFWRKMKLLCTDTLKRHIIKKLNINSDSFKILKNVVDFEEFDFKEENLSADESIIQYVNTSSFLYEVYFITEKTDYKTSRQGSDDEIKDCVNIFNINTFNKLLRGTTNFMGWVNNLKK